MNSTVVCTLIVRRVGDTPQILMTKRSANLDFLPGAYELPGGHVEPGESDQQALVREVKEELDLDIAVGDYCDSFQYISSSGEETESIYYAELISPIEKIKLKPDEIESFAWVTAESLDSVVVPTKPANDPELPIIRKAFQVHTS